MDWITTVLEPARILIVEDDADLQSMLASVLEDEGYHVETAARGEDAVERARRTPFDLVVADVRLPGMNGLDALAKMKEQQPHVGSLVITGFAAEADSLRAVRMGVEDYLKKPFPLADFLGRVQQVLAARRQETTRLRREAGLRRLAVWSLESRASDTAARAGRIAHALAREVGFSAEVCGELQLATLLSSGTRPPASVLGRLPARVRRLLANSTGDDPTTSSPAPLEAQILSVALRLAAEPPGAQPPSSWAVDLEAALVEAAERWRVAHQDEDSDDVAVVDDDEALEQRRRGLLSLARTLEGVGNIDGARQAFDDVVTEGSRTREALDAQVGLARLSLRAGDATQARDLLQRAAEQARVWGPATTARLMLEAGLLLRRHQGREAARAFLEPAMPLLDEVRHDLGRALCSLALLDSGSALPGDATLELLGQPEYGGELIAHAGWLHPLLAGWQARQPHALVARLQQRLERACPELLGEHASPPATPELPLLRVYSLGSSEVYVGGSRVQESTWKTQKNKYFFAFLAAHRGREVSEDVVLDTFWPGDVEKARRNLYVATSIVRRALQGDADERPLQYVMRQRRSLSIHPELPWWHDLDELQRAYHDANSQSGEAQLDGYRKMVQLYRGPFLDGCYMDWALEWRARVERQMATALSRLAQDALARDRAHEALEAAFRLLEIDRCHQEAHLLVMQGQMASGRNEEALRQFEVCRRLLRDELDVEPSTALLEAYHRARLGIGYSAPAKK